VDKPAKESNISLIRLSTNGHSCALRLYFFVNNILDTAVTRVRIPSPSPNQFDSLLVLRIQNAGLKSFDKDSMFEGSHVTVQSPELR
jgi:hypothetical protein